MNGYASHRDLGLFTVQTAQLHDDKEQANDTRKIEFSKALQFL